MRVSVKVQRDYLEKNVNKRNIVLAVSELIWNGLDGDADTIDISLHDNALGEVDEIRISDNGHGISFVKAEDTFEKLGNSWKKRELVSPKGRTLHGRGGEGRFSAFAIGRYVEWNSKYLENKTIKAIKILGKLESLGDFEITEPIAKKNEKLGTTVTISNLIKPIASLISEDSRQKLAETFAIYLKSYPAKIVLNGNHIDPSALEESVLREKIKDVRMGNGSLTTADLTVIEWKHKADRAITFCDANGFPLGSMNSSIHAPGYSFSVYLSSALINDMHLAGTLDLAELSPALTTLVERARQITKGYFRKRASEKTRSVVQGWKDQNIYPFREDPKNSIEIVERQVFDVVAIQVNEYLPEFSNSDEKSKRFSLQMLKSAIERSPLEAQKIIQDVLDLPKEKQEELAELLERTTLSSIINAAKLVSDRLEFLAGIDALIFQTKSKSKVKERSHLHRLIAENTWIFGEQFNLSVDDQSLTEVLRKHIGKIDKSRKELAPVTDLEGKQGIVDLMLSKRIPQSKAEEREHLVIELKRPSQKIDSDCASQIEKYAFAVAEDERFRDTSTRWVFWVISNDMDEHVRRKVLHQADRPDGLLHAASDRPIHIWVKTWGQVMDEARGRLSFFEKQLDYMATHDSGLDYLKRTHEKYLPTEFQSHSKKKAAGKAGSGKKA